MKNERYMLTLWLRFYVSYCVATELKKNLEKTKQKKVFATMLEGGRGRGRERVFGYMSLIWMLLNRFPISFDIVCLSLYDIPDRAERTVVIS